MDNTKNKTLISFKVDKNLRDQAKTLAKEIGIPLSIAFNSFLKQFVRDRQIILSFDYKPNPYLENLIKEAKKDNKNKKISNSFDNADDFFKELDSE